jgi:hypothetical protein
MVGAEALSTGQAGDERAAFGPALSTNSRRGNRLSRDQTAGNLLPLLCAHRDGCHEDRRLGRSLSENQVMTGAMIRINHGPFKKEKRATPASE